jgi:hypothetical protein
MTILKNQEREAALQAYSQATPTEWEVLVGFAVSVLAIQESVSSETQYLVIPATEKVLKEFGAQSVLGPNRKGSHNVK